MSNLELEERVRKLEFDIQNLRNALRYQVKVNERIMSILERLNKNEILLTDLINSKSLSEKKKMKSPNHGLFSFSQFLHTPL